MSQFGFDSDPAHEQGASSSRQGFGERYKSLSDVASSMGLSSSVSAPRSFRPSRPPHAETNKEETTKKKEEMLGQSTFETIVTPDDVNMSYEAFPKKKTPMLSRWFQLAKPELGLLLLGTSLISISIFPSLESRS